MKGLLKVPTELHADSVEVRTLTLRLTREGSSIGVAMVMQDYRTDVKLRNF